MERLELKDFDLLGIIDLQDIEGIEKLVTPVTYNDGRVSYLSRSKEYYNVKSMSELSMFREELKKKLSSEPSKRNFVILEYILNCSARVFFKKFEEYIKSAKDERVKIELDQARSCLMEDSANMIAILSGQTINIDNEKTVLPGGDENCERRFIEMDNKAMVFLFAKYIKSLNLGNNIEVLIPGYGSTYIGPFIKEMCGLDFTNILESKYVDITNTIKSDSIKSILSDDSILYSDRKVMLLDDNIGTGSTINGIRRRLNTEGKEVFLSGAVQYNWRNYYRISTGQKIGIDRFEVDDYDFITPLNYAGHKLYEHAVNYLNTSGEEYVGYLNSKGYRISDRFSDLTGNLLRGFTWAEQSGLELLPKKRKAQPKYEILEKYQNRPTTITNPTSIRTIKTIYEYCRELIDKNIEHEEYIDRDL